MSAWNPDFIKWLESEAIEADCKSQGEDGDLCLTSVVTRLEQYEKASLFRRAANAWGNPETTATPESALEWCLDKLLLGLRMFSDTLIGRLDGEAEWKALWDLAQALRGKYLGAPPPRQKEAE